MWHVVPGMKSTLNKITMVLVSYALYTRSFSLMAAGWVPGDVSFRCFSSLKWLLLPQERFNSGFSTHFMARTGNTILILI